MVVTVIDLDGDLSAYQVGNNKNKIYVCHEGTTIQTNRNASCNSQNSLCYHLIHGDPIGQCPPGLLATDGNGEVLSATTFDAFPNPFSDKSTIRFTMEHSAHVTLQVFDIAGKGICTLFNDQAEKGLQYEVTFDGANYPAGVYIYKAVTDEDNYTGKMILKKD